MIILIKNKKSKKYIIKLIDFIKKIIILMAIILNY